jgi:hypothetical protein
MKRALVRPLFALVEWFILCHLSGPGNREVDAVRHGGDFSAVGTKGMLECQRHYVGLR